MGTTIIHKKLSYTTLVLFTGEVHGVVMLMVSNISHARVADTLNTVIIYILYITHIPNGGFSSAILFSIRLHTGIYTKVNYVYSLNTVYSRIKVSAPSPPSQLVVGKSQG